MEIYSIGDFAKRLGVTPDFLKYCENHDIIRAEVAENGYRSYDFRQASSVFEYLKLKNQGFTGREIRDILFGEDSFEMLLERNSQKRLQAQKQILFQQELIRYYDKMDEIAPLIAKGRHWHIGLSGGFYFISHACGSSLSKQEEVTRRIREWNEYMPIVNSAMSLPCDEPWWQSFGPLGRRVWGFSVSAAAAERLGLDISAPCVYVKPCRMLTVYGYDSIGNTDENIFSYAKQITDMINERPDGQLYYRVVVKTGTPDKRINYGVLNIPLADEV